MKAVEEICPFTKPQGRLVWNEGNNDDDDDDGDDDEFTTEVFTTVNHFHSS